MASLAEIAQAVGSPPDAVGNMLQTLQRKGAGAPISATGRVRLALSAMRPGIGGLYAHGAAPVQAVDVTSAG